MIEHRVTRRSSRQKKGKKPTHDGARETNRSQNEVDTTCRLQYSSSEAVVQTGILKVDHKYSLGRIVQLSAKKKYFNFF